MQYLSRFFTSLILIVFGFFLTSPIYAVDIQSENLIVWSNTIADTCSWNIACEVSPDGQYICTTSPESLSAHSGSVHHMPVGQSFVSIASIDPIPSISPHGTPTEKRILYTGPDTYLFPYVGIIKIQV